MSSLVQYDQIYFENVNRIETGSIIVDSYLNDLLNDDRKGISLIIPIKSLFESYYNLILKMQGVIPNQYLYPFDDLHITIFDFIQGSNHYSIDFEKEIILTDISKSVIQRFDQFVINFIGITFSNAAGLIQGFDDNVLIDIREEIRKEMELMNIKNDERYKSESAHITFMRFKNKNYDPSKLINFIEQNRTYEFGNEIVSTIELVEHDWYNRKGTKRIIKKFQLTG